MFGSQGRRPGHPLGAARGVLADHAAALAASPFNSKEPWRYGGRGAGGHDRVPPPAAPAVALPAHHEPPGGTRTARRWCEPMYWSHPEAADAYRVPNQFRFGTELLVAPITTPTDLSLRLGVSARGCRRAPGSTSSPGLVYAGGRRDGAAPRPGTIPVLAPRRRDRPAVRRSTIPGNSPDNPEHRRGARRGRR